MKAVFEIADVPYNLRNQSKCSRSISCSERYGIAAASLGQSSYRNKKIINLLRNLKHELRVGFPKTALARYVNC